MATPTTDDWSKVFPSPGRAPRAPASPPIGLPDSPIGPFDQRTGMDIPDLDAWRAAEEEVERRLKAEWLENANSIREAIAGARANLEVLRKAEAEAEAAVKDLGPFDAKATEGYWLEGLAGDRYLVRRRWADAVRGVEIQQAALTNLEHDLKTRKWTYQRPEPGWRPQ
jgi:hypothetical protein